MYKTILVPIDMSHIAKGKANIDLAAQHAAAGARIILLNVVEQIPNWAAVELPAGLLEKSLEASQSELKAIATAAGMKVDVDVRTGHSYNTILEVAEKKECRPDHHRITSSRFAGLLPRFNRVQGGTPRQLLGTRGSLRHLRSSPG